MNEFIAAPKRDASHAGSAYPDNAEEARKTLAEFMQGAPPATEDSLIGIATPHVSPLAAGSPTATPIRMLPPSHQDRTFVILGTSHYGEPDRFGLTHKPFVTPFGESVTDIRLVDELAEAAPAAVRMEDYCHAIEHSIEFQVLFLQYLVRPRTFAFCRSCAARSCAAFIKGAGRKRMSTCERFFDSLGNISAREGNKLLWVLGVDMAHMGRRYGDQMIARAERRRNGSRRGTRQVADRAADRGRCSGFWDLMQQNQDDLKWCGSAPIYTFLKAVPQARGTLRRYQQWNIDEQSVVSFAAISFRG